MFLFFAKDTQQNVFDDILDILESKKAFLKSRTCSDWCIKKKYKEQQAIPSFHGIHRVEFLLMLLILQFHGWNLSLCVKDNVTTHFSSASNLKNICFFPRWFVHSQNHGNYKWFSCLGKGKVITECSAKINVNHCKQIRKLRNPN